MSWTNTFRASLEKILSPKSDLAFGPFAEMYTTGGWKTVGSSDVPKTDDWYVFKKVEGATTLAVGHLDYVVYQKPKIDMGKVHCGQLDDRLGVWIISEVLPALGIKSDILLCTNEEVGHSTAQMFKPADVGIEEGKYNWIYEFDRKGKQVVMYDYEDDPTVQLIERAGFDVGTGSLSDICHLDELGVKGFNFGTGYHNEHTQNCHADFADVFEQIGKFITFFRAHHDEKLPHDESMVQDKWSNYHYTSHYPNYGAKKGGSGLPYQKREPIIIKHGPNKDKYWSTKEGKYVVPPVPAADQKRVWDGAKGKYVINNTKGDLLKLEVDPKEQDTELMDEGKVLMSENELKEGKKKLAPPNSNSKVQNQPATKWYDGDGMEIDDPDTFVKHPFDTDFDDAYEEVTMSGTDDADAADQKWSDANTIDELASYLLPENVPTMYERRDAYVASYELYIGITEEEFLAMPVCERQDIYMAWLAEKMGLDSYHFGDSPTLGDVIDLEDRIANDESIAVADQAPKVDTTVAPTTTDEIDKEGMTTIVSKLEKGDTVDIVRELGHHNRDNICSLEKTKELLKHVSKDYVRYEGYMKAHYEYFGIGNVAFNKLSKADKKGYKTCWEIERDLYTRAIKNTKAPKQGKKTVKVGSSFGVM